MSDKGEEKFKENLFYKEFNLDNQEWKITTNEGKIIKSKKWLLRYEDVLHKEITPHVNIKMSNVQSSAKKKSTSKR
jgi:lipopolysaccharide export system protein LptC